MRPRGGSRVVEVRWCSLHLRVDGEGDCGGCLMVVRERRCWMREDGTVVVFRDGGVAGVQWWREAAQVHGSRRCRCRRGGDGDGGGARSCCCCVLLRRSEGRWWRCHGADSGEAAAAAVKGGRRGEN